MGTWKRNTTKKNEDMNITTSGTGILDVIQIIFIILKILGIISWRWVIVLIPLWIELGIAAVALIILGILYYIKMKMR